MSKTKILSLCEYNYSNQKNWRCFMRLWTVGEMRAVEQEANERGVSYDQMIAQAGIGVAFWVDGVYGREDETCCAVGLVGGGHNGSDTLAALIELANLGWVAKAYLLKTLSKDDVWRQRAAEAQVEMVVMNEDGEFDALEEWLDDADVLLDGLVGTGFKLPMKPDLAKLLDKVLHFVEDLPVVAVDCPSGMDCETGMVADETLQADLTICIHAVKTGQLQLPAFRYLGELVQVDLNLPEDLSSYPKVLREVASYADMISLLPDRPDDAHKGMFGKAMIVAGSINYTGAAQLAALAACRMGTGLVRLAVPGALHMALAGSLPEVTWLVLPQEMGVIAAGAEDVLLKNLEDVDALLLGPGWGREDTTGEFLRKLLTGGEHIQRRGIGFVLDGDVAAEQDKRVELPPLVLDADGLRLLAKLLDWPRLLPPGTILTPHPGEMAALTGWTVEQVQANRMETAQHFAMLWKQVVVLKGAFTVIAAPDGRVTLIPAATAALAHAGTGDVLAGMIVGLRAQDLDAYDAAVAAAYFHAQAGVLAEQRVGGTASVLARDVLEALVTVMA
jgi:NAD(P)H-hydrate epimerase